MIDMARGKKTDNETIYKVMLSYVTTNNFSETARLLDMPESTVRKIIDNNRNKEEFTKLCEEKKEDFINNATRLIEKASKRLEKQLDNENENIPTNHLTTVIGTLYDKRALARGESTSNTNSKIQLNDDDRQLLNNISKRIL